MISSTSIVSPEAKLGENVIVGDFSIIGPNVSIGDNTVIESNVVIKGHTKIGVNNKIYQFSSIGEIPQDKKYNNEKTKLVIGDNNIFREYCSVHTGTVSDQGVTIIGNNNLFLAYVHIAHDCIVGSHTTFSNCSQLAGHVVVDDHASLGGFSGVHQFCNIGSYSFVSGGTMVVKDILPFTLVSGNPPKPYGLNIVGLKRNGFDDKEISNLKLAYKIIYRENNTIQESVKKISEIVDESYSIEKLIKFIKNIGSRGITR